jgi:hypothetical protein
MAPVKRWPRAAHGEDAARQGDLGEADRVCREADDEAADERTLITDRHDNRAPVVWLVPTAVADNFASNKPGNQTKQIRRAVCRHEQRSPAAPTTTRPCHGYKEIARVWEPSQFQDAA